MSKLIVNKNEYNRFVRGNKKNLYKSMQGALRQSAKVTTNPHVITIQVDNFPNYLAGGDYWIDNNGDRGQYIYGTGGKLVELIDILD